MNHAIPTIDHGEAKRRLVSFLLNQGGASADTVIDDEQNLFDTGLLDSMGMFSLLVFLSEELGVTVGDLQPERVATISSILALTEA